MIKLLLALPAKLLSAAARNIELMGLLIAFALLLFGYFVVTNFTKTLVTEARSGGASAASAQIITESATKGLSDVQAAHSAADIVNRDPSRAIAECLRDSRTPENCH